MLEARTLRIRIQHAEHGVLFGRDAGKRAQPVEIPRRVPVGAAVHRDVRIERDRRFDFRRERRHVNRRLRAQRETDKAHAIRIHLLQRAQVLSFAPCVVNHFGDR